MAGSIWSRARLRGSAGGLSTLPRRRAAPSPLTLTIFFAAVGRDGRLFFADPEGLLSAAGHRPDDRHHRRPRRTSPSPRWREHQLRAGAIVAARIRMSPPWAWPSARPAARRTNNGRMFIALKPWDQRTAPARRSSPGCAQAADTCRAPRFSSGQRRTSTSAAASPRTAVPVHPAGRRSRRAERVGAEAARQAEVAARAARTSPPTSRSAGDADADHRPRPGGALRHPAPVIDDTLYDAFGQRQVAQYFTQVNSYHLILEVLPELQERRSRRWTSSTSSRR